MTSKGYDWSWRPSKQGPIFNTLDRVLIGVTGALLATAISCAALKTTLRTIDNIAAEACVLFGTNNPDEFEEYARSVLPPGAGEKDAFNPLVLCKVKEVLQPFLNDQIRLQQDTKAGIRSGTMGDEHTD